MKVAWNCVAIDFVPGEFPMKLFQICVSLSLLAALPVQAGECPQEASEKALCSDIEAIKFIYNSYCRNINARADQLTEQYCRNIVHACEAAVARPDAKYGDKCYKRSKEGEIVGYLPNGEATDCYQAVFKHAEPGVMRLKTLSPTSRENCVQR